MKSNLSLLRAIMALSFLAILIALAGVWTAGTPTQAAPPAAPTPLANFLQSAVSPAHPFSFQTTTALAADTNTAGVDVLPLGAVDIQYIVDQGTTNTLTMTVQYSNDNTNWASGLALVSSNTADGTDITRVPVMGRWMRINQDLTNTNTITITLLAVGR
jgi:hypothetical protein